jgi:iduronate 2-sulfatase
MLGACAQDDLRTELSLAYNHPEVSTPHLDALANKSMVFQNAYCQQPICSPSRNSFMRYVFRITCDLEGPYA